MGSDLGLFLGSLVGSQQHMKSQYVQEGAFLLGWLSVQSVPSNPDHFELCFCHSVFSHHVPVLQSLVLELITVTQHV